MTRIGKVRAWWTADAASPWFRLVIEGGRVTLGCWRFIGYEEQPQGPSIPWQNPRAIFERIS